MKAGVIKHKQTKRFLQLTMAMGILTLAGACATLPTVRQPDLDAWVGVSVEGLDTHPIFSKELMFRTKTTSGTEIRNYAYGYNFKECFGRAGASKFGDFVNENTFITCSSGQIVCNNLFYIREGKVLEYAPTGLCATDAKAQPVGSYLRRKSQ